MLTSKAKESPFKPDEMHSLYSIAQSLLREADYGELLADLLDLTIKAVGAERGFILARENGKVQASIARNFRSEALRGIEEEVSSSIAEMVLREGKALLISDASTSAQFRNRESVRRLELRSVLCAPVMMSSETIALIYLDNRDISGCFTEDHRRLLDEICALSSPRLRVAVSFQQAKKRAAELESSFGSLDGIVTADEKMSALLNL
ncbi:MAG TPA: GAF domain-containing protein, partial [Terriglobales bacterium]|nr:GAF domain-containing protein [Terriglobales bacterium]